MNKTCYELFFDRIPKIPYFKVFGCMCFLLNTKDVLNKFNTRSNEGIFVGSNDDDIVDTIPIDNFNTSHTNTDISNKNESSTNLP